MIEEEVKIHDKFSVEIKLGFLAKKSGINEFSVNTWLFIPNSLDVNDRNYTKSDFYRDLKTNIRLVTPIYLLKEISDKTKDPLFSLHNSFNQLILGSGKNQSAEYEYHIRMFVSILKSALRDEIRFIVANFNDSRQMLIDNYIEDVKRISANYRALKTIIDLPGSIYLDYYLFGDEFMSNLIEQHTFRLIEGIKHHEHWSDENTQKLMELILEEIEYKKVNNYPYVKKESPDMNRDLVFRLSLLKKYAENELFLNVNKQRDGRLAEQVYLSLAAGISMIFATAIAFSFQQQYGNLTMPFFVALVVSYMLKDRIKEFTRYYLAHRVGHSFFDHKTKISLNNHDIGWNKEAMDFVTEKKVPAEVIKIRNRSAILEADNRNNREQIILYRKLVQLNRASLDKVSPYPVSGMNDIIRFNVSNYILKMDNPVFPLFMPGQNNETVIVKGEKMYYLNLVMQLKNAEGVRFKRYRLVLNRKGIREIERF